MRAARRRGARFDRRPDGRILGSRALVMRDLCRRHGPGSVHGRGRLHHRDRLHERGQRDGQGWVHSHRFDRRRLARSGRDGRSQIVGIGRKDAPGGALPAPGGRRDPPERDRGQPDRRIHQPHHREHQADQQQQRTPVQQGHRAGECEVWHQDAEEQAIQLHVRRDRQMDLGERRPVHDAVGNVRQHHDQEHKREQQVKET
jgi:hypothetical protein